MRTPLTRAIESLELRLLLTSYVVDTATDDAGDADGSTDGQISLREAIIASNTNTAFGDAPAGDSNGDDISFAGDVNTITLANGEFDINDDLVISGNVTIDGNNAGRVFDINTGQNVELMGLTLTNGDVDTSGGALWVRGGAGVELGNVTITNSTASGDNAEQGGGGIYLENGTLVLTNSTVSGNTADGAAGSGGGILMATGTLNVVDSTIASNVANRAGGGIEVVDGSVGLQRSTLGGDSADDGNIAGPEGSASPGNGGGLHVTGDADVDVIAGLVGYNFAASEGGGLWNQAGATMRVLGGAFVSNNLALGDDATNGGGGIFNNGGTLLVEFSTIDANLATGTSGSGGGLFSTDGEVSVISSTLEGNIANRAGGGIEIIDGDLKLSGVTLRNNAAGSDSSNDSDADDSDSDVQTYSVDFQTLNSAYGSTADGTATLTLDTSGVTGPMEGVAKLRVQVDAQGLQDLTAIPGAIHVGHIHGVFTDDSLPFEGEGGESVNSILPSAEDDGERSVDETELFPRLTTDFLQVVEGVPDYGPVILNLTSDQLPHPPAGVSPLVWPFQLAADGTINPAELFPNGTEYNLDHTYEFDLSDQDARRQYNNLMPLDFREIVLHGLTIPTDVSDAIDSALGTPADSPTAGVPLGDGTSFRATAPVAAGTIEMVNGDSDSGDDNDSVAGNPGNGGGLHVSGEANVQVLRSLVTGNFAESEGGGLWNQAGSVMRVRGTLIENNVATGNDATNGGGGIFNNGGNLTVEVTTFDNNRATGESGSGGGLFSTGDTVFINRTNFYNNVANRAGGAVEVIDGYVSLRRSNLEENVAGPAGSANPGNGGAVHISGETEMNITKVAVLRNIAGSEGGGLWNQAGSQMEIFGSAIGHNVAQGDAADNGGGGIFNNGGDVYVGYSTVYDNVANGTSGSGGGLFSTDGVVTVNFSTMRDNVANRAGGGIEIIDGDLEIESSILRENVAGPEGSASPGNGGALHVTGNDADVEIRKSWIRDNVAAREGGGLWNQTGSDMLVMGTALTGNVAEGDGDNQGGGAIFNNGGALMIDYSQILRNRTAGDGGALHIKSGEVEFSQSYIGRNRAAGNGGGVFNNAMFDQGGSISFNFAAGTGGGILTADGATTETNDQVRLNTPNNFAGPGAVT